MSLQIGTVGASSSHISGVDYRSNVKGIQLKAKVLQSQVAD
ncbi:hypothetical protein [Vibrio sp. TRT 1302]